MTTIATAPEILSRFEGVRKTATGWQACCPAHDDNNASLSISVRDNGKTLAYCHAGCETDDVLRAAGLTMADLMPGKKKAPRESCPACGSSKLWFDVYDGGPHCRECNPPPSKSLERGYSARVKDKASGRIVAEYDYCDEASKLLYQAVRLDPKNFRQRTPKPGGGWEWKLNGQRRVLYRLPELLSADPAEAIYVVEGEKDVDRLRTLGFVATTNVGGASKSKNGRSKWKPEYSQSLKGRDVVILPDNDDVGSNHAKAVAASLVGVARSVKVLRLPDLPPKGDVSDFFESGGRADQLRRLAADSPEWMPATMAAVSSDDELSLLTPRGRTDVANAKRFVAAAGQDVRWCDPWGKWLGWDGTRWAIDRHRVIESKAKASAAAMWAMIAAIANQLDDGEAEGLLRYARASSSAVSIRNAIALARSEPGLPVLPEMLDCDPFLLNMENGTIDLRNGDIRDHRKSDYLTKVSPVRFNPAAACPIWLQTLETITNGNSELQAFLQRAIGLSLTGDCSEHALFFCFGNGANGKSTVLNTVQKLLGPDYAMKAPPDLLLSKGRDSHPTERADLAGKRFVACIEAGEGRRMAESLVKELTGGDPVRARRMREDFWEFDPTHKIWLAANHKPKITGVDNGIWRRVKLVPFTVQIPDHEQDKQLPHKLEAELPGIFNWAIRGCLEWQRIGLAEPAAVTEATAGYKREADTIGAYLVECCEEQTGSHVGATQLYKLFKIWSGSEMSQQAFGRAMSERGFDDGRYGSGPNKGRKCWMHIKLIDNPAETGECNGE